MEVSYAGDFVRGLPADVAKIIFNLLNAKELAACKEVCTRWSRDLFFLLDELDLQFDIALITNSTYYQDNIKKFCCRRIKFGLPTNDPIPADALYRLVSQFPKLTDITLDETHALHLNPTPLEMFSEHKPIKNLHYDHLLYEETKMAHIAKYTQLTELDLYLDVQLSESLWEAIKLMPKLRKFSLKVRGPNPTLEVNWNALSGLQSLRLVNLGWRPFETATGSDICTMTNLTQLELHGPYSSALLEPLLNKHTTLQEFITAAVNAEMLSTPMMQHLRTLQCNRTLRIDETVPTLRSLVSLAWRPSTPIEFEFISRHVNLTRLELRGTYLNEVYDLVKLTNLKHLELHLPMTKEIAAVIKKLPKLEVIESVLPNNNETQINDYRNNFHQLFGLPDYLLAIINDGIL